MNLHKSSFDAARCVVDFAGFFVVAVGLIAPQQAGIFNSCGFEENDELAGVEHVKTVCDAAGGTVEAACGASLHHQHFNLNATNLDS